MYSVELSERARAFLSKLDRHLRKRIEKRIRNLASDPVSSDAKFIGRFKGDRIFRYRIGKYRSLYRLKDKKKTVLITKIDKRPRVYSR